MSFDLHFVMGNLVTEFEAALKAAYNQGVKDGIARIVAAAQQPIEPQDPAVIREVVAASDHVEAEVIRRAPRGLVPNVVGAMLRDHPGKIIAEYEAMIPEYDSRVSTKSIGNELRRYENEKYRRNSVGEWFPMSGNEEAAGSATNETPTASDHSNESASRWNRLSS